MESMLVKTQRELMELLGEMWAERDGKSVFPSERCVSVVEAFEEAVREDEKLHHPRRLVERTQKRGWACNSK
jgi:hypothetical protein